MNQTKIILYFPIDLEKSENSKYNPILVLSNKIQKIFLCVYDNTWCQIQSMYAVQKLKKKLS